TAALFSLCGLLFMWLCYAGVKERYVEVKQADSAQKAGILQSLGDTLKPRQRRGDDNRVNSLRFFNACACFLAVQRWHVMCNNVR
ncbi:hypothetical protein ONJ45_26665, partial [Salmonella enterica subsp. enterica serovar Virginia]|nr:hypothetical protein [Salmonella enterica subsp. enterica serovar Virginia]